MPGSTCNTEQQQEQQPMTWVLRTYLPDGTRQLQLRYWLTAVKYAELDCRQLSPTLWRQRGVC